MSVRSRLEAFGITTDKSLLFLMKGCRFDWGTFMILQGFEIGSWKLIKEVVPDGIPFEQPIQELQTWKLLEKRGTGHWAEFTPSPLGELMVRTYQKLKAARTRVTLNLLGDVVMERVLAGCPTYLETTTGNMPPGLEDATRRARHNYKCKWCKLEG